MKSAWILPWIIPVVVLICTTGDRPVPGKPEVSPPAGTVKRAASTPVYDTSKTTIVDILETAYPRVAERFADLFPAATNQLWVIHKEALSVWFRSGNHKIRATFTRCGKMIYAICDIRKKDLPATITASVHLAYPSHSIINARKIMLHDYTFYEVMVERKGQYVHVRSSEPVLTEFEKLSMIDGR